MVTNKCEPTAHTELGQERSERIAAGHVAAVLASERFVVRIGGVPALVPADEVVALVQFKNNPDCCQIHGLVRNVQL